MSTADVDDPRERPEVISFGNGLVAALAQGDHGTLKQGSLLWVFRQPVKPWAPEHLVEGWLSGADRMQELLEGKISLAVDHTDEVTGTRCDRSAARRPTSSTRNDGADFPKHPFRREKSHYTIKRVSIRLGSSRQFIHRLLTNIRRSAMPSSIMTRSACDTANPNPSLMICCVGLGIACLVYGELLSGSIRSGTTQSLTNLLFGGLKASRTMRPMSPRLKTAPGLPKAHMVLE